MAGVGRPRRGGRRGRRRRDKGVIWSRQRARKVNKRTSKSAWAITFSVKRDLAYDVDMRDAVAFVSLAYARHFSEQLGKGERPEGGKLQDVTERTKQIQPRARDQMGMRSGYGAKHWWLGKLSGSPRRAKRLVKPYGGAAGPKPRFDAGFGRDKMLNVLLKRGFDFQSVRGKAAKAGGDAFAVWLKTTIGENPGTTRIRTSAGTLDQFKGDG